MTDDDQTQPQQETTGSDEAPVDVEDSSATQFDATHTPEETNAKVSYTADFTELIEERHRQGLLARDRLDRVVDE
jgi:hypothetical protein